MRCGCFGETSDDLQYYTVDAGGRGKLHVLRGPAGALVLMPIGDEMFVNFHRLAPLKRVREGSVDDYHCSFVDGPCNLYSIGGLLPVPTPTDPESYMRALWEKHKLGRSRW